MHTHRIKLLMESKLFLHCKRIFMDFDDNLLQDILNITGRLVLHVTRIFSPGLYLIW